MSLIYFREQVDALAGIKSGFLFSLFYGTMIILSHLVFHFSSLHVRFHLSLGLISLRFIFALVIASFLGARYELVYLLRGMFLFFALLLYYRNHFMATRIAALIKNLINAF